MTVRVHLLAPCGAIPNHPRWPLLVYQDVFGGRTGDLASMLEDLFSRNRWPAAWRNGVFPFHHYHSNAHEVLGVYDGEVTAQFGGDSGITVTAKPGDVIVLPAGTGHKRLSTRGTLGVVGAYPEGSLPDTCTTERLSRKTIESVPAARLRPGLRCKRAAFRALEVGRQT